MLNLLAQGHTVKSIATLTGKSEGSVNERLREARRKTGAASSRELARLLTEAQAQENRDKQIGMAISTPVEPGSVRGSTQRSFGPLGKGVIAMAILSGAALAAVLLVQQTPPAASANDPLLSNSFAAKPWPSPAQLHARLRSEERDIKWATEKEAVIRAVFTDHAGLSQPGDVVRVTCGKTLCEVAVTMQSYDKKRTSSVVKGIQDRPLYNAMESVGLAGEIMSFGNTGSTPSNPLFVSYWHRK